MRGNVTEILFVYRATQSIRSRDRCLSIRSGSSYYAAGAPVVYLLLSSDGPGWQRGDAGCGCVYHGRGTCAYLLSLPGEFSRLAVCGQF